MSRALGDFYFKKNKNAHINDPMKYAIIAFPDVKHVKLDDSVDFAIIGSDGLWNAYLTEK
jgi:serine/threonine protein phosphatase PrpC